MKNRLALLCAFSMSLILGCDDVKEIKSPVPVNWQEKSIELREKIPLYPAVRTYPSTLKYMTIAIRGCAA